MVQAQTLLHVIQTDAQHVELIEIARSLEGRFQGSGGDRAIMAANIARHTKAPMAVCTACASLLLEYVARQGVQA